MRDSIEEQNRAIEAKRWPEAESQAEALGRALEQAAAALNQAAALLERAQNARR